MYYSAYVLPNSGVRNDNSESKQILLSPNQIARKKS